MTRTRHWCLAAALPAVFGLLAACSDSPPPDGAQTTPPPTPANTAAPIVPPATAPATPPAAGSTPPAPPSPSAEDVDARNGADAGMVGGASGTTASGDKPGTGTDAGAGTGPAGSSDGKTSDVR